MQIFCNKNFRAQYFHTFNKLPCKQVEASSVKVDKYKALRDRRFRFFKCYLTGHSSYGRQSTAYLYFTLILLYCEG